MSDMTRPNCKKCGAPISTARMLMCGFCVKCDCAPVPAAPAPETTGKAHALCGATTGPLLPGVYDRVHTCTRPSGHFGRHWDGESGWGHVPTREEEQAWCDGMLVQVAALSREIQTLRAALAKIITEWDADAKQPRSTTWSFQAALQTARNLLAARAPEPQP